MIKNLSKSRFLLILSVVIFLAVVLIVQFIVLFVLRTQSQNLDSQLTDINAQIEQIPDDVSNEDKTDYARWDLGYIYDDENVLIEQGK